MIISSSHNKSIYAWWVDKLWFVKGKVERSRWSCCNFNCRTCNNKQSITINLVSKHGPRIFTERCTDRFATVPPPLVLYRDTIRVKGRVVGLFLIYRRSVDIATTYGSNQRMESFSLPFSVCSVIQSQCPKVEEEEVRRVLGDSVIEEANDLRSEVNRCMCVPP